MKKWITITFLLLSLCQTKVFAALQDDVKFSLLRQLSQVEQGDTARLQVLFDLVEVTKGQPEVRLFYINRLIKESEALNNNKYKCKAYLSRIYVAYNTYDVEGVKHWVALLEPLARKEQLYDIMFMGRQCAIDYLSVNEEYELQEYEANKMLKEAQLLKSNKGVIVAYQCLYNVYQMTYRQKEAAEVLQKALELAVRTDEYLLAIEVNGYLIESYELMGDNENWRKYIDTYEEYIAKTLKRHPDQEATFGGVLLMLHIYRLNYTVATKDFARAARVIEQALEANSSQYGSYSMRLHSACYYYYEATKQYEHALTEVNTLIDIFAAVSPTTRNTMEYRKANILIQLNRHDEALEVYKTAGVEKDSLQLAVLNKQTQHIRQSYDADSLILKQQRTNRHVQIFSIGLVIIILLVFVYYAIHISRVRQSLHKSEQEMREMAQEMERMNLSKERFLSGISHGISDPLNVIVSGSLQFVLNKEMGNNHRKELSESINTTSNHLMKLINNILDLSRFESGMMKYALTDIELGSFLQSLVRSISPTQSGLKTILPVGKQLILNTDINKLTDFYMRLLSPENATPGQEVVLDVTLAEGESQIHGCVRGTTLAEVQTQDTMVLNEINRFFVEHFGGSYRVVKQAPSAAEEGHVEFVLPVTCI